CIETGRNTEAVFALERVLIMSPKHAMARAEIGRAYFNLREHQLATTAFEIARGLNPPDTVVPTIERFLDILEGPIVGETTVTGYLSASLGMDSNTNSGAGIDSINFLNGTPLTITGASELDDFYSATSGGVRVLRPISEHLQLVGNATLALKRHNEQELLDSDDLRANGGIVYSKDKDSYTLQLELTNQRLDHHAYKNSLGVNGNWLHKLSAKTQFSMFAQILGETFPGQRVRDAKRFTTGVGLTHGFGGARAPVIYGSAYGGSHDIHRNGVPHLSYDLYGIRGGAQINFADNVVAFASLAMERREHGGPDPSGSVFNQYAKYRKDNNLTMQLGLNFEPAKNWQVIPSVTFFRNDSNVIINDYERVVSQVTLRRNFK
ncbi:MAG: DUF560 domain-containing protein, partial [Gammaproteobacteria bacterium]|nr:DUF560 domain-containing protein [Gammaproteobacteria bacterium]